jgi:hypothetical protein
MVAVTASSSATALAGMYAGMNAGIPDATISLIALHAAFAGTPLQAAALHQASTSTTVAVMASNGETVTTIEISTAASSCHLIMSSFGAGGPI